MAKVYIPQALVSVGVVDTSGGLVEVESDQYGRYVDVSSEDGERLQEVFERRHGVEYDDGRLVGSKPSEPDDNSGEVAENQSEETPGNKLPEEEETGEFDGDKDVSEAMDAPWMTVTSEIEKGQWDSSLEQLRSAEQERGKTRDSVMNAIEERKAEVG